MLLSTVLKHSVQVLIFIRRNPSLSPAEFYDRWENTLGPLVVPLAENNGFITYKQLQYAGSIASDTAAAAGNSAQLTEYDGVVLIEVPTLDNLNAAFSDPYYVNTVAPAEQKTFDWDNFPQGVVASINGTLVTVISKGEPVNGTSSKR